MNQPVLWGVMLCGLLVIAVIAHFLFIEVGREVVTLRTQSSDGNWQQTRLWVVDHQGDPWLHSAGDKWEQRFATDQPVELIRGGVKASYIATPDRSQHSAIDQALRDKYGIADRWVRLLAPCDDSVLPVRLTRM